MSAPKRIALVSLELSDFGAKCHDKSAAEYLLDDFEDAYHAYALDTASEFGLNAEDLIPEFMRSSWQFVEDRKVVTDASSDDTVSSGHDERDAAIACDTVILSCEVNDNIQAETLCDAFAFVSHRFMNESRVYAIVITQKRDAVSAQPFFDILRSKCEATDCIWMGGIVIGGGALIPRFANAPRMGFVRHRISEAIDVLVMAVRSGERIQELQARLGMPQFVYYSLCSRESFLEW